MYQHDTTSKVYESGHLIWIYFCNEELESSWNKRSTFKIGSKDQKGNDIYHTLIRFLTSKGMRKDAEAVYTLTNAEVLAIQQGASNVNYQNINGFQGRVYETLWEVDLYKNTGDANGHSLTQRFEYWKTAFTIIKNNPVFGVGTGDVPDAFEQEYIRSNSSLAKEWRLRAHNQYLSFAVAFGVLGFALVFVFLGVSLHCG